MMLSKSGTSLMVLMMLVSCKKSDDPVAAIPFSSVVSFGDSLSDAGTYQVGLIKAAGGGLFTVNGVEGAIGTQPVPSLTWAQLVSAAAIGQPSCAARVGGFGSSESNEPAVGPLKCRNYAQGGARVTDPKGVGNPVGVGFTAGPLTEPVITQLAHFADDQGSPNFDGTELITMLAGPNDLFAQIDILTAASQAAGSEAFVKSVVTQLLALVTGANKRQAQAAIGQAVLTEAAAANATPTTILAAAIQAATPFLGNATINPADIGKTAEAAAKDAGLAYAATTGAQNAAAAMAGAADTLASYVKDMIKKGARYVVVVNIPDVSQTPLARKNPSTQPIILAMTEAFNHALDKGLTDVAEVVLVDAFSENQRQFLDPDHYQLSNVTDVACNLNAAVNPLSSSLICNTRNLIDADTSHYLFADDVHPTPYGHKLLAQFVTKSMVLAGWL